MQANASASFNFQTCFMYIQALQHGVKYIYQTMPRMLTLWLDLGESKDLKK
jgi:serine/threonine-protein kinase ATR